MTAVGVGSLGAGSGGAVVGWWLAGCAPNGVLVEQVNVTPVPNWRVESPIVDQQCTGPPPCVRVGCTVRSQDRGVIEADVRLVLDVRPEPLVVRVPIVLGPNQEQAVSAEFADVVLDPGQTFGRCEIALAGAQVLCWVRNPSTRKARFGLRARLADGGDPPPEQTGSFSLHPGESRPIPFGFDRPGRVGTCVIE